MLPDSLPQRCSAILLKPSSVQSSSSSPSHCGCVCSACSIFEFQEGPTVLAATHQHMARLVGIAAVPCWSLEPACTADSAVLEQMKASAVRGACKTAGAQHNEQGIRHSRSCTSSQVKRHTVMPSELQDPSTGGHGRHMHSQLSQL